jgi:hypothetical protein
VLKLDAAEAKVGGDRPPQPRTSGPLPPWLMAAITLWGVVTGSVALFSQLSEYHAMDTRYKFAKQLLRSALDGASIDRVTGPALLWRQAWKLLRSYEDYAGSKLRLSPVQRWTLNLELAHTAYQLGGTTLKLGYTLAGLDSNELGDVEMFEAANSYQTRARCIARNFTPDEMSEAGVTRDEVDRVDSARMAAIAIRRADCFRRRNINRPETMRMYENATLHAEASGHKLLQVRALNQWANAYNGPEDCALFLRIKLIKLLEEYQTLKVPHLCIVRMGGCH